MTYVARANLLARYARCGEHAPVQVATNHMIVDETARLHERVADPRADKAEPSFAQRFTHRLGFLRGVRYAACAKAIDPRLSADERPQIPIEAAVLPDDFGDGACVGDGGHDLGAVAHDSGLAHQPGDLRCLEARHARRIEPGECFAVVLALAQDRDPREPGLSAFEDQELEQTAIVVNGSSPFAIVIGAVQRIAFAPRAALRHRALAFARAYGAPSSPDTRRGRSCLFA